jgi:hypothetical protein
MDVQAIFGLQFFLSFITWGAALKWLAAPGLAKLPENEAFSWLVLPHTFRHLGMVFLVPTVVARPLPEAFAGPAAYGDLLAGLLALAAFVALRKNFSGALGMVWLFNIIGAADLLYAVSVGTLNGAAAGMGSACYIPTHIVPLLLITHAMVFARLLGRARRCLKLLRRGEAARGQKAGRPRRRPVFFVPPAGADGRERG